MPALLAEDLALAVYQRAEHGVQIDAHEVEEILRVAAGYGVISLVREGHGVEEGVHRGLHQLHEGLLGRIALRAAEHGVLQDVKHARVVLRQGGKRNAEGAVLLAAPEPHQLQTRALMTHVIHDRIQLMQGLGADNGKSVVGSACKHTQPPFFAVDIIAQSSRVGYINFRAAPIPPPRAAYPMAGIKIRRERYAVRGDVVDLKRLELSTSRMRTERSPERDTARAPLFWPSKAFCQLYLGPCIARDS